MNIGAILIIMVPISMIVAVIIASVIAKKRRNDQSVSHFTPSETITFYYADWCAFCKEFRPKLDEFKQYVVQHKLPVQVVEVEASDLAKQPEEIKKKVQGFPTVIRNSTNEVFLGAVSITELFEKLKNM